MVPPVVLYLGLCALIALIGRKRSLGFLSYFLCSVILSPVVGLLIVLVSSPRDQESK